AWKRESTAREEERAREEAIEKEKARRSAINKQRIINFRKGVEHWVEYQEMAAFLGVVKEAFEKTDRKNADTKKWIQWAENYLSNYSVISEDMIRYDVEEYRAEKTNSWQKPAPPPEEPYNYWKRPWYQRGVHR
ncbi:MAG: hypothetical protein LBB78_10205, partial [Spirochaetaceae bacterium]|nr:hypothetical protein [Spirochaetaceae bacterium]